VPLIPATNRIGAADAIHGTRRLDAESTQLARKSLESTRMKSKLRHGLTEPCSPFIFSDFFFHSEICVYSRDSRAVDRIVRYGAGGT
jgi:hypothetical protein